MKICYALAPRLSRSSPRCGSQDDSLTRLREMQRAVQARRTDLRARGIRGKADEADTQLTNILGKISDVVNLDDPPRKTVSKRRRANSIAEAHGSPARDGIQTQVRGNMINKVCGNFPFRRRGEPLMFDTKECELGLLADFTRDTFARTDGILPWKRLFTGKPSQVAQREDLQDKHSGKPAGAAGLEILEALNESQRQAVLVDPSLACLVLAGPGSGKTKVLAHRVAYLVKHHGISPYKILAVTFTNKAAREMCKRIVNLLVDDKDKELVGDMTRRMDVGTFHKVCAKLLRKYGEEIGVPREFGICDKTDARSIITRVLKDVERADEKNAGTVDLTMKMISKIKNISDDEKNRMMPHIFKQYSELRNIYDDSLRRMKLLDFDDILLETRRLLEECPSVLKELQNRVENVLVDEWQDTNQVQFDIVSLLAGRRRNLFVVGDADQSIYKFRGADSGNLQRFCEHFRNAVEVTLDRNYRSSGCIIEAAQAVINEDKKRPSKQMITTNGFGNKVVVQQTADSKAEARFVLSQLNSLSTSGELARYSDAAVFYRTNAQSRQLEEVFLYANIPYKLQSGVRFYERAEIKDVVGYIKLIANPDDDSSFRRIVNTPPRGMGQKAVEAVEEFAQREQVSMSEAVTLMIEAYRSRGETFSLRATTLRSLAGFYNLLYKFRKTARHLSPEGAAALDTDEERSSARLRHVGDLVAYAVEEIKYRDFLESQKDKDGGSSEKILQRLANVDELIQSASRYDDVRQFLENVALFSNADKEDHDSGRGAVSLMTLHGGKGLEFKAVFIVGAEDGVIPTIRRESDENSIDEERRLLYVGMTRAKKFLYLSWRSKKLFVAKDVAKDEEAKCPNNSAPSRFLKAIPKDFSLQMTAC